MARSVKVNLRGLEEVATSREMHAAIEEAAERVESAVRSQGIRVGSLRGGGEIPIPVEVHGPEDTTDMKVNRAKAYVTLAHPAGLAVQAKHGVLTRAASAAGLRVRS